MKFTAESFPHSGGHEAQHRSPRFEGVLNRVRSAGKLIRPTQGLRPDVSFAGQLQRGTTESGIQYVTATPPDKSGTTEPTVLIVHGFKEKPPTRLLEALYDRNVKVAAIRQPTNDHPVAEVPGFPATEVRSAEDNVEVMDELPGELIVAGISRGYINGTLAASKRAERIPGIIAVNGALVWGEAPSTLVRKGIREARETGSRLRTHPEEIVPVFLSVVPSVGGALRHPVITIDQVAGLPTVELDEPHRLLAESGTTFHGVFAGNDNLIDRKKAEQGGFDTVEFIPGATHLGHATHPDAYADAIVRRYNHIGSKPPQPELPQVS